jgi:hypothetical protein
MSNSMLIKQCLCTASFLVQNVKYHSKSMNHFSIKIRHIALSLCILLLVGIVSHAQQFSPNYDETKVPEYHLPELLIGKSGQHVKSVATWQRERRPEILKDFTDLVYGRIPEGEVEVEIEKGKELPVFEGTARMKEVKMTFRRNGTSIALDMLLFLPNTDNESPMFLGLNFYGNHTICRLPDVSLTDSWIRNNDSFHIRSNKATEASRGVRQSRWPVEMIIARGYGLATVYYGDIDPDKNDFSDGVHPLFYSEGQTEPANHEWRSISAWAWGLSKVMDYFEMDSDIDANKVALMGHSRLGKTSLWAGAIDERFAIVISNNSGCGGAALSRRKFGETVGRINSACPHWFCGSFKQYSNNEDALPVDQHQLISLIAPRPVYVSSAQEDRWADPKGEFMSAFVSGQVYELYGLQGLPSLVMPPVNEPIMEDVGYHIRTGGHDVTVYDWNAWMDFADKHFNL